MTALSRLKKPRYQQTFVYICLVLVVLLAFYLTERNQNDDEEREARNEKADEIARCQSGEDSRNVQRDLVDAIYNLAVGSIARDVEDPPLKPEEVKLYNAYIDRVNHFRSETYAKIHPSALCAPYVEDDDVKPPSPPTPRFLPDGTLPSERAMYENQQQYI